MRSAPAAPQTEFQDLPVRNHQLQPSFCGAVLLAVLCLATSLDACPFCTAVSQTFSEEIGAMDVAAFARLVPGQPLDDERGTIEDDPYADVPPSKFEVTEVLKGDSWVKPEQVLEIHHYGVKKSDAVYLIMGTDAPQVIWSSPLAMSSLGAAYVKEALAQPPTPERLQFFQRYLEHADEMLARDAYDEFAKAPYADVVAIKDAMDRDRLTAWIQDPDVPASRRRLYLTMLGVCGRPEDAALLEKLMTSDDRVQKSGLDAMVACYLMLTGEQGLPLIEKLFLNDPEAEYADTYAAIMALRFHGAETEVLSREQILNGFRAVLTRPELADLVIPDLARWEDWSVIPRLLELYRTANDEANWVRVPIVNYMRACPLPEAEGIVQQLREIDPDAVRRASAFFPFAPQQDPAASADLATGGDAQSGDQPGAAPNPPEIPPEDAEAAVASTNTSPDDDPRLAALPAAASPRAADPSLRQTGSLLAWLAIGGAFVLAAAALWFWLGHRRTGTAAS